MAKYVEPAVIRELGVKHVGRGVSYLDLVEEKLSFHVFEILATFLRRLNECECMVGEANCDVVHESFRGYMGFSQLMQN